MKHVLIILFTISFIQVNAQKFVRHKDSVNRFSIFIPAEWKYTGEEKQWPGIIFSATRVPVGKTDRARDNFSINVTLKQQVLYKSANFIDTDIT